MKKFRIILIFVCIAIIIGLLFDIDYQNFFSRANLSEFLGILAMIIGSLGMIYSNRHDAKNNR